MDDGRVGVMWESPIYLKFKLQLCFRSPASSQRSYFSYNNISHECTILMHFAVNSHFELQKLAVKKTQSFQVSPIHELYCYIYIYI